MARKFGTYLICLLFANYCLANPVAEGGENSKTPQDGNPIFKGSHVLEFEESACVRASRLGSQLITQVKLGSIKPFLRILWLGASVTLKDERGNTALHYASMGSTYAHCKMAVYLLACGADPKIANNEGDTPVHYAAHCPTMLNIFMKATCIQEASKQS